MIKTHPAAILLSWRNPAIGALCMSRRLPPLYALRAFEAAAR
ncbi:hypothetical protein PMI24_02625, partial [Pseudomonas sp. GM25]